jgi:DNA-binding NarL/FixJ family response regulator
LIRVAVVDDHPIYRSGLAGVVEAAEGLSLAVAVGSVEELDAERSADPPDVVLLDLHLPGLSGPAAVAHVCGRGMKVLVLSAQGERELVLDSLAAGALGYLTKDADAELLISAISAVNQGRTYVSPTLASFILTDARSGGDDPQLHLTPREQEILGLVADGERDTDIGKQLFISVSTVRTHLDRIRDKTGQRRRASLATYAIRHRLVIRDDRQ